MLLLLLSLFQHDNESLNHIYSLSTVKTIGLHVYSETTLLNTTAHLCLRQPGVYQHQSPVNWRPPAPPPAPLP